MNWLHILFFNVDFYTINSNNDFRCWLNFFYGSESDCLGNDWKIKIRVYSKMWCDAFYCEYPNMKKVHKFQWNLKMLRKIYTWFMKNYTKKDGQAVVKASWLHRQAKIIHEAFSSISCSFLMPSFFFTFSHAATFLFLWCSQLIVKNSVCLFLFFLLHPLSFDYHTNTTQTILI